MTFYELNEATVLQGKIQLRIYNEDFDIKFQRDIEVCDGITFFECNEINDEYHEACGDEYELEDMYLSFMYAVDGVGLVIELVENES